ncbi:MAG: sodium:solute symporter family protein [Mariniphaga sp.]|nr:sodium:solute symporter family protein [Mariniphaga sp.]
MLNIIIILYFLIVAGIGIYARFQIKSPKDFYIAGKKSDVFQVSGSLLATILGGSAILGTLELSQQNGWAAIWFLVCASLGLFILAPISKYVNRFGKFTLPELLGRFYGEKAELISSAIIPIAWLGIIAAQIIGAAKILNGIGILGYSGAAILSGIIFILYTLIGGQKSILKTDMIQSFLILTVILFIFILTVGNNTLNIEYQEPQGLINSNFTIFDLAILFLTYSTTFIVGPDIYSRIFCAQSEKKAFRSVIITAIILLPFAFIITYLGVNTPVQDSAENISGIILYWQNQLPLWVYGLLIAALLSAVMSSADTTLLTASMIVSKMFYGPLENKTSYLATKISIIVIGIFSITISIFVSSIIQSLLIALSFFSGAFLVPTLAGLLSLKANKKMIVIAILTGGIIALAGKLIGIYENELIGNLLIIASFIINAIILFFPEPSKK